MPSDTRMDNLFWALPPGAEMNEQLRVMHAEIAARLKQEFEDIPGVGILEILLAERVAFYYIMMRLSESDTGFTLTKEHKDTTMLWSVMANQLRAMKAALISHFTEPVLQEVVLSRVVKVIAAATRDLPEDIVPLVQARMEAALATEGV